MSVTVALGFHMASFYKYHVLHVFKTPCSVVGHISVHIVESSGLLLVMIQIACAGMFSYVCWLTMPASFNLPRSKIGWHDGWETFGFTTSNLVY